MAHPDDRELGELGERLAAAALRRAGWRVLGRRVRTSAGEVDLVARRAGVLLALEVKTSRRPGPCRFRPADRHRRRARVRQARALARLALHLGHPGPGTCGVAEVFVPPGDRASVLLHLPGPGMGPPTGFHPAGGSGR